MNPGDPFDPMNPLNPLSPLYPHVMGEQQTRPIPDRQALALVLAAFAVALGLLIGGMLLFV